MKKMTYTLEETLTSLTISFDHNVRVILYRKVEGASFEANLTQRKNLSNDWEKSSLTTEEYKVVQKAWRKQGWRQHPKLIVV